MRAARNCIPLTPINAQFSVFQTPQNLGHYLMRKYTKRVTAWANGHQIDLSDAITA